MSHKCATVGYDKINFYRSFQHGIRLATGISTPYTGLGLLNTMFIFGLKCLFCSGALETLSIQDGVMSTKCSHCGHLSRPKPIEVKNTVYSRFANKKIEVQYNAKRPRSGEYRRVSVLNDQYPDRKRFGT